jgi:DNA repair protein RadC
MARTEREIREKLIVSGAGVLSDSELLAVVIREGTELLSPVEFAEKIIADFGGSLTELASANVQRLRRAGGCGTKRAAIIAATAELARRITAEKALSINTIASKDDVARIFAPLAELPHEEFWILYLTSGGRVIDRAKVSQGGVSGTVVDYRLIVKRAIELLATSIILVHNHPSGVAQPSRDDVSITEMVSTAAALFDINVVDHIIISRGGLFSFAEKGMMAANK